MPVFAESQAASVVDSLITTLDLRKVLAIAAEKLGQILEASTCVVLLNEQEDQKRQPPLEWSNVEFDPALDDAALALAIHIQRATLALPRAISIDDPAKSPLFSVVRPTISALNITSVAACSARAHGLPLATVILYRINSGGWSGDQIRFLEYVAHFLGVAIDNCRRAEQLRESKPAPVSDLRGSISAVVRFEPGGCVSFVNPPFEALSGYPAGEVVGWNCGRFVDAVAHDADKAMVLRVMQESISSKSSAKPFEFRLRHRLTGVLTRVVCQFGVRTDQAGFEFIAVDVTDKAEPSFRRAGVATQVELRYQRMVENADAVVLHIDVSHVIDFVSNRALDFFGIAPEDFLGDTPVHWYDLAHLDDRERLEVRSLDVSRTGASFDEEFRIINHLTGRQRWILSKFVPVHNEQGEVTGWDGFGIDITARKEAQTALDEQSKKVRALYTVSSAIRGYLDPANIASRGLAALCEATGADAGLCYLYPTKDSDELALVAHHGFSADFVESVETNSNLPSLSKYVADHGQSIVVPDLRTDPRSSRVLAEEEGIRSAVLVPICVEEETLGTLGLFNQQPSKFDGGDVMLVAAAANQIGLAARQANLFAAYRKQTKNLAALYRMSHELSGFLSIDEIFHSAFSIIRDELDLRRLWLGLLNEAGTRIVGQAAYGPGWKKRLVEMNVEIDGRDHPIAQVVSSRKSMIIDDPEKALSEFGIKRFFTRFSIRAVGLVPLVAGGQVLGVLAFQPDSDQAVLDEEEMTLISSLASEIAAIVLAKRLEERIAQGDKMRAAGLLAAGIAHNFNNLLQAILGQASLLEMQFPNELRIKKPAKTINEAATKGAALVKQLVSFANLEEPFGELCDVNTVVERGVESLSRNLREGQQIELELSDDLPKAYVDPRQLLRILQTLVTNAGEALGKNGIVHIFSDQIVVDRESPHYEVPYGEYIRVGVRDDGIGMDSETKRRCFEPFFTTKNLDPNSGIGLTGAGLGLAAAYALARKNGGRLVVDSQKGKGSVFTLYLPARVESSAKVLPDEFVKNVNAEEKGAPLTVEVESYGRQAKEQEAYSATDRSAIQELASRNARKTSKEVDKEPQ